MQEIDRTIAEKYGLEVRTIMPYKDAFIVNTSQGKKVLKKLPFSTERILFIHGAKEHLASQGMAKTDRYLCTLDGEPYFFHEGDIYVLSEFIEGRECNFDDDNEVKEAAALLATFHKASKGYVPPPGCKAQDELGRLPGYFNKRLDDIKKLKKLARKGKSRFDHLFLECVDYFYGLGLDSVMELPNSAYNRLVAAARAEKSFCHHDFTHHNILCSGEGMTLANFEYCCFELKVYDIANFLRRRMRKCNWDVDKAKVIIDNYCRVEPVSGDEFAVMKLMLQFPQKFWRIVNKYYNSRRSWSERSYVGRLEEVMEEIEPHARFMKRYEELIRG